tara:strand:+ start:12839 stop:13438 length:600 start_codon:yes stop_codon:yes gene_type:complete
MATTQYLIASDSELLNVVKDVFTQDFHQRLFKYALVRMTRKFGIRYDLQRGFRGVMIEDIIADLMLSFVSTDVGRNWNKTQFPLFEDQVFSAFDSAVSNALKKELEKTSKTNSRIHDQEVEARDDGNYTELLDAATVILQDLGASDDEILLFEPYVIHGMKRSDVAATFGVTEQEATNIKKKIERKLPIVRQKLKNMSL